MASAAAAGMTPIRDSARASAASTSSIAWTQARSETVASIISVLRLGPKRASDGKEHRLPLALQPDVEVQHPTAILRDERVPTRRLDQVENWIGRVGLRLVGKIHPRHQVTEQATREDRHVQVRSLHPTIRGRRRGWLDRDKAERALGVCPAPAESGAYLPDLEERVGNGHTFPVEDLPLDSNRAGRSRRHDLLSFFERQSDTEERPDRLRWRQGSAHGSFSTGV